MAECDHWLGIVQWPGEDEWLRASKREETAALALRSKQKWLAQGLGSPSSVARVAALDTPEKALADRTEFFAYCPDCGAKLEGAQGGDEAESSPPPMFEPGGFRAAGQVGLRDGEVATVLKRGAQADG